MSSSLIHTSCPECGRCVYCCTSAELQSSINQTTSNLSEFPIELFFALCVDSSGNRLTRSVFNINKSMNINRRKVSFTRFSNNPGLTKNNPSWESNLFSLSLFIYLYLLICHSVSVCLYLCFVKTDNLYVVTKYAIIRFMRRYDSWNDHRGQCPFSLPKTQSSFP